jgi:hypothetical protein
VRTLETDRLTIRAFAPEDGETYSRLLDAAFGADSYGSADEKRVVFDYQLSFWALFPDRWGHGYATEAAAAMIAYGFEQLRLRRIVATTEHDNARSINVMRRLGMRLERNPRPEPAWFQTVGILDNIR